MKVGIIISLIFILLTSCTKENEEYTVTSDTNYHPSLSGSYIIYDVIEINIDEPSNVFDTINYQLKELIGDKYYDETGAESFMLRRYKRYTENDTWSISDIWSFQLSENKFFQTEENIKYVKIHFPLSINKTWDGNSFNTLSSLDYEITAIDKNLNINSLAFDSCLTVTHELDSSLIHKNFCIEQFARNTGLIYKEETHINSQEIEPGVDLENRITTGTIYKQTIVEQGIDNNYEN
jgi:hypothetical protein